MILKSRQCRAAVTWGILTLFVVAMTGGQGLHCLHGLGHSECRHETGGDAVRDVEHGNSGLSGVAISNNDHPMSIGGDHACVICVFLASAHCLPSAAVVESGSLIRTEAAFSVPSLHLATKACVYSSRAPPAIG
jgi:hypothetical protein